MPQSLSLTSNIQQLIVMNNCLRKVPFKSLQPLISHYQETLLFSTKSHIFLKLCYKDQTLQMFSSKEALEPLSLFMHHNK